MNRSILAAAAGVVALAAPGVASATHGDGGDNASCVAQFVVPGAHAGRYGEVVSFLAHEARPLGPLVAAQAQSPRDECLIPPPE